MLRKIGRRIALALCVSAAMCLPISATHAAAPGWQAGPGVVVDGTGHHGVMLGPDGIWYLCAADGEGLSASAHQTVSTTMGTPIQVSSLDVTSLHDPRVPLRQATITNPTTLAQMAWIASTANVTDNNESAAWQIALTRAAGMYEGSLYEMEETGNFGGGGEAFDVPIKRSVEVLEAARTWAGPYTTNLRFDYTQGDDAAALHGIGVKAASGQWVAGYPFTVTLTGPGHFADGSTTASGTTTTEPLNLSVISHGLGRITAHLNIEGLPSDEVWISTGSVTTAVHERRAQNLIVVGKKKDITSEASMTREATPFTPHITTLAHNIVKPGDPLIDTVTIDAADWARIPGSNKPVPVTVNVGVYGPFDTPLPESRSGADIPDLDKHLLGTYSIEFSSPGTANTPATIKAPGAGFYFFHARVLPDEQGDYSAFIRESESPFFEVAETTVAKWQPSITTHARIEDDGTSKTLIDTVTVEGMPENHGKFEGLTPWEADNSVMTHSVYFAPEGTQFTEGMSDAMDPVATVHTRAANGTYEIEPTIDWSRGKGTYFIVSRYEGDSRTTAVRTSELDTNEHASPTIPQVERLAETGISTHRSIVIVVSALMAGALTTLMSRRRS